MTPATTQPDNESTDANTSSGAGVWMRGPAVSALLPDTMRLLDDGRDGIVIINYQNQLTAFRNACLHQGSPIHAGDLYSPGILVCPWHNWCYDVRDGACLTAPGARLEQFAVRVEDGHVWVSDGHK